MLLRYHHQLMQMIITLVLFLIVFTVSSTIFADSNYYKALFTDYLKHTPYFRNRHADHEEPAVN